jgi:hypothetical protein
MDPYRHKDWRHFREEVIKLDGGGCVRCLRSRQDGVVLQVHHKTYVLGRLPWEYSYEDCETLCKGCHAEEHGIIMPQSGWISMGGDDLGEYPADTCERCGTDLRHIFLIQHPKWGALSVGADCHDRLTGTTDAREFHDRSEKLSQKRKRFVASPRWEELPSGELAIEQQGIWLRVSPHGVGYRVLMDAAIGKTEYPTILDAKMNAFELIESGAAAAYLERRRLKALARKCALRLS